MGSPTLLDNQATGVLQRANSLTSQAQNHVEQGAVITDGGTTQGSGANTAPNLDLDADQTFAQVAGSMAFLAAATDIDSDAGDTVVWGALLGKTVIFAVVLETGVDNDTPAWKAIPGAVADDGSEVAPTAAEIGTAVGHANWIMAGDVNLQRTGDTALTLTVDYARRGGIKGKTGTGSAYSSTLAVTEDEFKQFV